MLQIIVILLVAYILIPLNALVLNQRLKYGVEVGLYVITAIFILWTLFAWGRV